MASLRDLKTRKHSIQSTQQITKAMKLVATAKLQKAKSNAEATKNYFNKMYDTVESILQQSENVNHEFLQQKEEGKKAYIVLTSNKGLAGGYNSNVVKLVKKEILKSNYNVDDCIIYSVGNKGRDALRRDGYNIGHDYSLIMDGPTYIDAQKIGTQVLKDYVDNKINEIYLVYTEFHSTISQEPKLMKLLPIEKPESKEEKVQALMNFEPSEEAVIESVIPRYIISIIYGALMESVASEHGARMTAMDSATTNADEMIDKLSLEFNRVRQASITQEISEIVGGADALN